MTTDFTYTVRDSLGKVRQGTLAAESMDLADAELRQSGFAVLELNADDDELALFSRPVRKGDIIYLTNQLSVMVDTGTTLAAALTAIMEQEKHPGLRKVLQDLRRAVESGDAFSTALARHPKLFDQSYISLIRVSEATGSLPEMLERTSTHMRKQLETRNKVRAAMAYPLVILVMAVCVTVFLLTFVLPKFIPIFDQRGIQLPAATRFLIAVSDLLTHHWYLWLGGVAVLALGFVLGKRTPQGRHAWDGLKISLPVVGATLRKVIISRTLRTLGVMVQSGVPILDSLRMTAEISHNAHYQRLFAHVVDEVTGGNEIHAALSGTPLLPATLVQMIKSGEESGRLDTVLSRISDYYDQEVETSLKAATSLIEPLMIAIMGLIVGGIGLALLLPIFSLSAPPT